MINEFNAENIELIGKTLNATVKVTGNVYRLEVSEEKTARKLALEIHINLKIDDEIMHMVSVYAHNTFLQLHNCTGFVISDLLNQATFFGKSNGKVSGLIVEKEAGCSLYANVNESLLNGDFTKLPTEVMMSSVALSLTDTIDFEGFSFDDEI